MTKMLVVVVKTLSLTIQLVVRETSPGQGSFSTEERQLDRLERQTVSG